MIVAIAEIDGSYAVLVHAIAKERDRCLTSHREELLGHVQAWAKSRPLYSDEMIFDRIDWSRWVSDGIALDDAQDYIITCSDTTPDHPGIGIGPAWDGIVVGCEACDAIHAKQRVEEMEAFKARRAARKAAGLPMTGGRRA